MGHPVLPPSKFGAGYTVGAPAAAPAPQATATPRHTVSAYRLHPSSTSLSPDAPESTNRLALAAFVMVLFFGLFAVWLTLPMAHIARRQIAQSGQGGAGLAKAAIAVGYCWLAVGVAVLVLALTTGSSYGIRLV